MYCIGTGYDAGVLHEVDLETAEDNPYLKEDEGCLGAAYSADGDYVGVIGPISQSLVLTVLAIDNDDVPLNEVLDGSVQRVPSLMTWNDADVMTVIEGDTLGQVRQDQRAEREPVAPAAQRVSTFS